MKLLESGQDAGAGAWLDPYDLDVLMTDADLGRAFTLSDGMWWLPTREAQLTTVWTVIEMLMRPGRRDNTTTRSASRKASWKLWVT